MTSRPSAAFDLPALLADLPVLASRLRGIERAAQSDAPVLLVGEPGSGRSTLARALHTAGARARGPLVELDPAVLPSSLFESELFGHRAGAFTGADRAYEGRVQRAEGGTLVLDHVEELPAAAQPKLLRLLAERRCAPLGGREREVDVRFVAVACEDLAERVERGAFRRDLFYRLEVLAFRVPPLRERREELPRLVELLLADLAERLGRPVPELSVGARQWLFDEPWPGNLTQLRGVLERALVLSTGGPLDLPRPDAWPADRPRTLAEVEAQEIRRALAFTRGRQGLAAELLGISRKALWEKRKRYGIP